MTFTFKIGKHYARPLYWLKWWAVLFNPKKIERIIEFTDDSAYQLDDIEQPDRNKIIGLKYGLSPTCASARFVQWYNPKTAKWEINWYVRNKGQKLADFDLLYAASKYEKLLLTLKPSNGTYMFKISGKDGILAYKAVCKNHKRKLAFLSGPYFGGNKTSPNTHSYKLSKS